jgi:predicted enzyme related to lactoylglutathione lyase
MLRRRAGVVIFALMIAAAPVRGAGTEALTWDHMHLAFPDPHAATEWYIKYLGAAARPDGMDGVFFGPIRFNMRKAPSVVGSGGAVIDSVGLSFADVDAQLKALEGSGAKIVQTARAMPGMGRVAIIEDPWGTRIELVQDAQLLGFHHVRVRSQNPATMRTWFAEKLGGEPGRIAQVENAVKFGGIWLIIDQADAPPRAADGTTLDHLGFRTKDIKTEIANLQTGGVRVLGDPRQDPNVATTYATFFESPTGRTELTQR